MKLPSMAIFTGTGEEYKKALQAWEEHSRKQAFGKVFDGMYHRHLDTRQLEAGNQLLDAMSELIVAQSRLIYQYQKLAGTKPQA